MVLHIYQTDYHCTKLLGELSADNLNAQYMVNLKYVCKNRGEQDLHKEILDRIPQKRAVAKLADISLYTTYLNSTLAEINANPAHLYNLFAVHDRLNVAKELRHLEGILYFSKDGIEQFYYDNFVSIENRIAYAIEIKDLKTFAFFLSNSAERSIITQDLSGYLTFAYHYESLNIAILLLSNGARFNVKDLIRIRPTLSYLDYQKHIDELSVLNLASDNEIVTVVSLVRALFCISPIYKSAIGSIIKLTHLTETLALQKICLNCYYNEVTQYIFGVMIAVNFPHILIPSKGNIPPFFSLDNGYGHIYVPDPSNKYFLPQYIHELTHAFLHSIFQNANAYPKFDYGGANEYYRSYQKARISFLKGVLKELEATEDVKNESLALEFALAKNVILHAHEYCVNHNSSAALLLIILKNHALKTWDIWALFAQQSSTENFHHSLEKIGNMSHLMELIEADQFFRNKKSESIEEKVLLKEMILYIAKKLNISVEQSMHKLTEYKKIKEGLGASLKEFCLQKNWTTQYSTFLSRIFDYSKRENKTWDSELLPRFAEVYIHQKIDPKVEKLYYPLMEYWKTEVIPAAEYIMQRYGTSSAHVFIKAKESWTSRMLSYFASLWQDDEESNNILTVELEWSKLHIDRDMTNELLSLNHTITHENLV